MSYFNYTDLISSLLDPRLVNPGSTLTHVVVGAYDPKSYLQNLYTKYLCCYIAVLSWCYVAKMGTVT